ncbi:MAG: ATP-grasp domain-containing protein [Frankiaceae bacterium]
MTGWFVLVESNTTGSGRLFCAAATQLGLRPVLLARDPGRYPYVAADRIEHRVVDTGDPDAVLAACERLGGTVAGVVSSSEYYVGTAGEVARSLGLPHPDPDAVRACRDKSAQRALLRAAGLPSPAFAAAATADEAVEAAAAIGLPVVVKPVAGSGSIGVRRCASLPEVREAASYVLRTDPAELALPPQPAVLVEEYLDGAEHSVETLDDQVIGVTRKHLGQEPHFVETGHDFPAPLPPADRVALAETALAALRALGLGWGAAHVELRHAPGGPPRVIEVNPRLAGGMIPRVVQEATGIDMIRHLVASAAGRPEPLRPTWHQAASIRFLLATADGRLTEIAGVADARRVPGVVEVGLIREAGHDIVLRQSFQDRLGYVIASAQDGAAAARAAEDGLRMLRAWITPCRTDIDFVTEGSPS